MNPERQAFVGIGSNLDRPREQVLAAIARLGRMSVAGPVRSSSLYRTPPWGQSNQPDFINAVVRMESGAEPGELLEALQELERAAGRARDGARWGPRVIDLDLLLFGDRIVSSPELTLPHPRMHERAFVLVPLLELDPDIEIPGRGRADELLRHLDATGIELTGEGT